MDVAVLGLGSIGLRHARNLLTLGCRVRGFDPSESARVAAAKIGVSVDEDARKTLSGANAAVVASPNAFHLADLEKVIDAGLHAFVEKPLAHTEDGIIRVLDRADATKKIVAVGFNLRHHPGVRKARHLVRNATFGAPLWGRFTAGSYMPDWRPSQDYRRGYASDPRTGGVIFDIIHEFDVAHFVLGPAKALAAVARNTGTLDIKSEDCADVLLQHETGTTSSVHIDYVTRPSVRITEIALERGFLRLDLIGRNLVVQDEKGNVVSDETFPGSFAEDYVDEMQSFIASVEGHKPPACDGREGLAVLRLAIAARRLAGLPE